MPRALLLTLTEPHPQHAEEFNAWYDDEHMAERLSIHGFLSARRWVSTVNPVRYLATYELTDIAVFDSAAYLAHYGEHQTAWSKRNLGRLKVFIRWACIQMNPGDGDPADGRAIFLSAFDTSAADVAEVIGWYDGEHLPMLAAMPGVRGARRFLAASASDGVPRNVALYELNDPALPDTTGWRASGTTSAALRVIPLVTAGRLRETFIANPRTWSRTWR